MAHGQTHQDASAAVSHTPSFAVSARSVTMMYGGQHAVQDVSFDLSGGSFLTILGPSGSGKTTLLRMIAGFQTPTSGEIFINGAPVNAVPPYKRSIGMVFQKLALFPHMTAAENVAFPLKMRRFDVRTIPQRVAQYLDIVRLGGLAGRRIHELSGGQQQRVAIARALVFEPDLLLLDEPLAALDRRLREEMQLEFRRIQRVLGVTTINVTHDQREALVVSDEIIVMDHGRVQQMAKPSVTYNEPDNAFVAGFIGVTNFLVGPASDGVGGVRFSVGNLKLTGHPAPGKAPLAGEMVEGALRAERIRIASSPAQLVAHDTIVSGTVADAIFEGERAVYEVRLDEAEALTLRVFDNDSAQKLQFTIGAPVSLGWNTRDLLVFLKQ